jgi:hypothetical protein
MLAVLVLAAVSLKGAASSMSDYPIAVASRDFSLSLHAVCLHCFLQCSFFYLQICKVHKFWHGCCSLHKLLQDMNKPVITKASGILF